jgi:hypothetical protein
VSGPGSVLASPGLEINATDPPGVSPEPLSGVWGLLVHELGS